MTDPWREFSGPNAAYVLALYDQYRLDPASVSAETRAFFERNPPPADLLAAQPALQIPSQPAPQLAPQTAAQLAHGAAPPRGPDPFKVAAVLRLAQAVRWYGHWDSALDPLGSPPPGDPSLRLETYGLSTADLEALPADLIGGRAAEGAPSASEALQALRWIYSGTVGHDYLQIRNAVERDWLREAAESGRFSVEQEPADPLEMLRRLTEVEVFEHFLQRSFPAKTRFSIEGLDVLVPLLDGFVGAAAEAGIYNILIGMAHRGRLNLLANVLKKPVDHILAEFKDPLHRQNNQDEREGWRGDVKYHAGARRDIDTDNDPSTVELTVQMAPNPSHLEAVNPVIAGMARAAGTRTDRPGPAVFDPKFTLPLVIHGDAAFPGQGVVAETLNLHQLEGYETGGTIHIIANNQIGFTSESRETRSTLFASDLAKGFRIPVIHANADDPDGVIMAARIAFAYRERFHNDFLIDLIGYRRLGHNEGDEPAFTQPLMYRAIEAHPSVRKIWADRLVRAGLVGAEEPEQLYQEGLKTLQGVLETLDLNALREPIPPPPPPGAARKVHTAVDAERLQRLNRELQHLPDGFHLHPRLARIRQRREALLDEPATAVLDWAAAEELALATILEDGAPIRLTGQDAERGTFSHRHAVLHDVENGSPFVPLQNLAQARASFEIHNSPLSEYAALGFEFGYNIQSPSQLVIWEAQYGDFINNAQTVVDEFITTARDKWGQLSSLVLLLPHGYEGQGPDHSSARLERFLGLAADTNLRVVNCTTAANYFHVLRRQAALLVVDPLPLVVMTPKSLLRHPLVSSPLSAFSQGGWQAVIDPIPAGGEATHSDGKAPRSGRKALHSGGKASHSGREALHSGREALPSGNIRRLILCSGKVYMDLVTSDLASQHPEIGIARLEQLAPFPAPDVQALLAGYPALEELVWVQEEPENMGAWDFLRPFLSESLGGRARLGLVARPVSASPAEGSSNLHAFNQRGLVERAFASTPSPSKGLETGQDAIKEKL